MTIDKITTAEKDSWVLEVVRIANEAVAEAIAENKRHGIPESFWKAGKLYYVTAEGELTTERPPLSPPPPQPSVK